MWYQTLSHNHYNIGVTKVQMAVPISEIVINNLCNETLIFLWYIFIYMPHNIYIWYHFVQYNDLYCIQNYKIMSSIHIWFHHHPAALRYYGIWQHIERSDRDSQLLDYPEWYNLLFTQNDQQQIDCGGKTCGIMMYLLLFGSIESP